MLAEERIFAPSPAFKTPLWHSVFARDRSRKLIGERTASKSLIASEAHVQPRDRSNFSRLEEGIHLSLLVAMQFSSADRYPQLISFSSADRCPQLISFDKLILLPRHGRLPRDTSFREVRIKGSPELDSVDVFGRKLIILLTRVPVSTIFVLFCPLQPP